jgi:predicted PurR-regulated permease PerM
VSATEPNQSAGRDPWNVRVNLGFRTLLLIAAGIVGLIVVIGITQALLLVAVGIFLAFVFEFPLRMFMEKTHIGRGLSATILVLGAAVLLAVLGLLLLVPLLGNLRDFLQELPQIVDDLRNSDELSFLGDSGAAGNVQSGSQTVADRIPDAISALVGAAGNFFGFALSIFTIVFVALFVLIDMNRIKASVLSVLGPEQAETTGRLWERITVTISRWAIGAGVIAIIAGTVQGTTAWLLGSSYALALGLIAGFLDLIPNLGATIAGFILTLVLWAEEGITAAIIMLAVVLVYQQIENNILTPTIQKKATNIWASLVITSVTIFGALLGVFGAIVAVPLTASIQLIIQEITADRRERIAALKAAQAAEAEAPTGSA